MVRMRTRLWLDERLKVVQSLALKALCPQSTAKNF